MLTIAPETLRRLRRVGLYAGFGLAVFVAALYFSFPSERAKEIAIRMAADRDLDLEIGSASPAFGLAVTFRDIQVRTKPTTGKPTRFTVDAARISVSPFSLLSSQRTYTVSLDAFGGTIELTQSGMPGKKAPFKIELRARGLKMSELPGVREAINVPLSGTAKLDLELRSATGHYADASGEITFSCDDCTVGDGKTPFKVAGNPFLAGGLTLPKLHLGDFGGRIAIDKGLGQLQGIEAKSPDGEVALEGDVALRDPLASSNVNAYLRFKLGDAFLRQASSLQTLLQMAAAPGKRPDGSYGLRISGRLGQLNAPVLSPTSPIAPSAPGRPGTRAAIAPSARPAMPSAAPMTPLPPNAPVPLPSGVATAEPPPPAPPSPPPPPAAPAPAPPPEPATAPPPPGPAGWHGGAGAPGPAPASAVADAAGPATPSEPPPNPPAPAENAEPPP